MRNGYVYFVETHDSAFVKIGFSTTIRRRLADLLLILPGLKPLGLIACDDSFERQVHKLFRAHHERGEWFRQCDDIRQFITERAKPLSDWPDGKPIKPARAPKVQSLDVPGADHMPRSPTARPKRPSELDRAGRTPKPQGSRLTVSQAAIQLHVSPQLIRRWIAQGRLRASRVANQYLVQKKDVGLFQVRGVLGRPRS